MFASLLLTAAVLCAAPVDDLIPASIEAALAPPDDPQAFGLPPLLDAETVSTRTLGGTGRCVLALGDVTGDGLSDYAVGLGPDAPGHTLQVLNGDTGETVWSARPGNGVFRSLRGLARDGSRLLLGVSSGRGRVEVRDSSTGTVVWSRTFVPATGVQAQVSAVRYGPDIDGDGQADVLVAGGGRIEAAYALSGADGRTLWMHPLGDVVADAVPAHDGDGDGLADVLIVGGEVTPLARLISSADGGLIWEQLLDAPGSVGLGMDDIDADGTPDVVVGQFNEPGPCVLGLDGADGTRHWISQDMRRNVTSLVLVHDTLDTGLRDVAVGSFDNAVNVLLGFNGGLVWRREASIFNGASMFSVAATADLDGNGSPDVLSSCLDHRVYLHGGTTGQFMAMWESGRKLAAVGALPDITGDGRPEVLAAGHRIAAVLDGGMGLASGPQLDVDPELVVTDPLQVVVWSYPNTKILLWASLGTGAQAIPGVVGTFGLDLGSLVTVFQGPTPGAGAVSLSLPSLPPSTLGLEIWMQAGAIYSPSHAILSSVSSFVVVP